LLNEFIVKCTTAFTARTCTYTAVRYCSITESVPLLDEGDIE